MQPVWAWNLCQRAGLVAAPRVRKRYGRVEAWPGELLFLSDRLPCRRGDKPPFLQQGARRALASRSRYVRGCDWQCEWPRVTDLFEPDTCALCSLSSCCRLRSVARCSSSFRLWSRRPSSSGLSL